MSNISWSRIIGDEFVENFKNKFKTKNGRYKWWKILYILIIIAAVIGFYISVFSYIKNPENKDAARAALILAIMLSTVYFIKRIYRYAKKKTEMFNIIDKLEEDDIDIACPRNNNNNNNNSSYDRANRDLQNILKQLAMMSP